MEKDFNKGGFFSALTSMKNVKSLSIDRLPCKFYKTMWGTVGDDFCALAHELFSSGTLSEFLNQGFIKIIQKNSRRDSIIGCRSIILFGVA